PVRRELRSNAILLRLTLSRAIAQVLHKTDGGGEGSRWSSGYSVQARFSHYQSQASWVQDQRQPD
ncbi:MAG: hypothetical protein WAL10_03945, partial [Acetobacteraceae bacterium]